MKKNLKKILILLILFVLAAAGYFTWSWMQLREDGAAYTSIEDANLPVAYVNILGRRMNELDGFVEDSQKAAGRGDLTLLPADRKLSVTIDKLDSQITGMQYEIRSLDGERLVERTTLDHWEQSGEEVSAEPEPSDGGKRIPLNDCDRDGKAPGNLFLHARDVAAGEPCAGDGRSGGVLF